MTRVICRAEVTCAAAVHGVLRDATEPLTVRQIAKSPQLSGWTEAAVWFAVRRLVDDRLAVISGARGRSGGAKFMLPPIAFNPPRAA